MQDVSDTIKRLQEMREGGYLADAILREAVKAIKAADDRYDWVGVYLLNEDENVLWLHNYIGKATEHARIGVGEGVCGTAVAEKTNQNIADVTTLDNYIACDPETRSELVILIHAGDEILGQIDIDSDETAAFSGEDEATVQAVADKLAEVIMAERR